MPPAPDLSAAGLRARLRPAAELPGARWLQRQAAVAAVLRYPAGAAAQAPAVLLMRRAERRGDPWSGQVSLPGGRAQPEDGSVVQTAARETREEVGVDLVACAELLGGLPEVAPLFTGLRRPLRVTPLVFQLTGACAPAPGPEATRVFWLPLQRVLRGELDSTYRFQLGPAHRDFPCWRYEGEVVWGMTHRILGQLLGLTP